jgi:hypothetical protein
MRYVQIAMIHQALTALGQERLPVAYEVAKNLKACDKIMVEVRDLLTILFQKYVDRDLSGNIVEYEEDGQKRNKISDPEQLRQYNEEIAKIDAEDYEIKFTTIPGEKLAGKEIAASILLPLLDVVITD